MRKTNNIRDETSVIQKKNNRVWSNAVGVEDWK